MRIAETKQQHVASGTNRLRNPAPKAPPSIAISLTSTTGPIARKASWAVGEKLVRETAMKASASEHRATMTASKLNTAVSTTTLVVKACIQAVGTQTLTVAAIAAPMTRKPQDWMKSWVSSLRKVSAIADMVRGWWSCSPQAPLAGRSRGAVINPAERTP